MSSIADQRLHAIVALSLLETMQTLDAPQRDDPLELQQEVSGKRLGTSESVTRQVERYQELGRTGGRVEVSAVADLFTLCSRRSDAKLLYADAGRLAAHHALAHGRASLGLQRALPGGAGRRMGFRATRRLALDVLGLQVTTHGGAVSAVPAFPRDVDPWAGLPCAFFGSALGVLLQELSGFEGAVLHDRCEHEGADRCVWSAGPSGRSE